MWVAGLAGRRLRGRPAHNLLVGAAVALAVGLTATIGAIGGIATERAIAGTLQGLDDGDRAIRITAFAPSGARAAEYGVAATNALGVVADSTGAPALGLILRAARDGDIPYDLQAVAVDGAAAWTTVADGRAARPCDGWSCEAILLSRAALPADLPEVVRIAGLEIRIVGRGTLTSGIPLGRPDERGPQAKAVDPYNLGTDPAPALLLVDGVAALAGAPGLETVGRTYLATAPIRTAAFHAWTIDAIAARLDEARSVLVAADLGMTLAAPSQPIAEQLDTARRNAGRLVLIGALGVAALLAFAGYAALLGRRDLVHELERLAAAGAGRVRRATLVAVEIVVPVAVGSVAGWVAGAAAAFALALGAETDPGGVVGETVVSAGPVATAAAIGGLAFVVVVVATAWRNGRDLAIAALPALILGGLLVSWQVLLGDAGQAGRIASPGSLPAIALVPVVIGLAIAAAAVAGLPRVFRRLAAFGRGPLPIRLGLLSIARDAARPAAAITMLGFGVGTLIFAATYQATLAAGIVDEAAYRTGLDLRVIEAGGGSSLGATVAPLDRYEILGAGSRTAGVTRINAQSAPGGALTVLGVAPDLIGDLPGWRDDFAALAPAELADLIRLDGVFRTVGQRLPAGETTLRIPLTLTGDPIGLTAVVLSDRGVATSVSFEMVIPGSQVLAAPLPPDGVGGTVIGFVVSEGRIIAGQNHPARLRRSTLTIAGFDGLIDDGPHDVEASGTDVAILRADAATDHLALPALVSPDLAAAAAGVPSGTLLLQVGGRRLVEIRPAAVAERFPTLGASETSFAIVAADPLLVALDAASPGAGHPNEAWIRLADAARHGTIVGQLGGDPFRSAAVVDRIGTEERLAADPFAASAVASLFAAAVAGLLLAVLGLSLGVAADLRDESGELRDLEAQGLEPHALRRVVTARTIVLALSGALAGTAVGTVMAVVVAVAIGLAADARIPVPPLRPVISWAMIVVLAALPVFGAAALGGLASRRILRDGRPR